MRDMHAISMFYGILIRLYADAAIKVPHFHASYRGYNAAFDMNERQAYRWRDMPAKQQAYIKAWTLLREEELFAKWTLALHEENLHNITPLR